MPAARQIQPTEFSGRFEAIKAPTTGKARKGTKIKKSPGSPTPPTNADNKANATPVANMITQSPASDHASHAMDLLGAGGTGFSWLPTFGERTSVTGSTLRLQVAQRGARGPEAAQPVHGAPRRGRGRAEVEARRARRVRVRPYHGPGEELPHVHEAAVYVPPDQVGVPALEVRGSPGAPGQDAVSEAGGEALYLRLYPPRHVEGRAVGDVAVGPHGVLALGGAGRVEEALLGEQDERPPGGLPAPDGGPAGGEVPPRGA